MRAAIQRIANHGFRTIWASSQERESHYEEIIEALCDQIVDQKEEIDKLDAKLESLEEKLDVLWDRMQ